MTIAVADAGPLVHLAEVGALSQLKLFERLVVPDKVWEEATQEGRLSEDQLAGLAHVTRRAVNPADVQAFIDGQGFGHPHAGESECLLVCVQDNVQVFLTDDLAVREAASTLTITPVGSLGVIVRENSLGRLTLVQAEQYLQDLHRISSLFVTRALVDSVLVQLRLLAR